MPVIYTGQAVPLNGMRKLSGTEAQQRAKAMACVRSTKTECHGQVYVGLFFDGTGNNEGWVEEGQTLTQRARNKHSNVARLWDAHLDEPVNGFSRVYIPGVGTPFKGVGDTGILTDLVGNGFGYMGADRINWGITSLLNSVHIYLTNTLMFSAEEQKTLVNAMSIEMLRGSIFSSESVQRWAMLKAGEAKLAAVIKSSQRKVTQINVSMFGFSRGAAEARACAHWLNQILLSSGGGFTLAGIPVRIGFMGLFDTVAAVGIGDITPVTFGHMAWADGTQSIHPGVEECAHFIALHEQRASFPLESATGRGNVGYPGMHSDLGGGYYPGEQGKGMSTWGDSPQLSQIPLLDMHFASIKGGVAMSTIEEIKEDEKVAKSFSTDPKMLAAYNGWLRNNGIKAAQITEFTQAHARQYLRWRGTMHANNVALLGKKRFYQDAPAKDKKDLLEADSNLGIMLRAWRERKDANATFLGVLRERTKDVLYLESMLVLKVPFVERGKDRLSKHEDAFLTLMMDGAPTPAPIAALFEDYVHDSRAGFRIGKWQEPEWLTGGYARYRDVFIQSGSNQILYNAANESLNAVEAAADATVTFFKKLYRDTVDIYAATRARIEKTAHQVYNQAVKTGHQVHDKAVQTADQVGNAAKAAGNEVIRAANEAARQYALAERKVLNEYVPAEEEYRRQLKQRWDNIAK
jgi:hypothetical protein